MTLVAYAARRGRQVGPAGQCGAGPGSARCRERAGPAACVKAVAGFERRREAEPSVPGVALRRRAWDDCGVIRRQRELHAAIAAVGLAAGVAAFALTQARNHDELRAVGHPEEAGFVLAIGWSFIAGGLIAWGRRPQSRFGPLLVGGRLRLVRGCPGGGQPRSSVLDRPRACTVVDRFLLPRASRLSERPPRLSPRALACRRVLRRCHRGPVRLARLRRRALGDRLLGLPRQSVPDCRQAAPRGRDPDRRATNHRIRRAGWRSPRSASPLAPGHARLEARPRTGVRERRALSPGARAHGLRGALLLRRRTDHRLGEWPGLHGRAAGIPRRPGPQPTRPDRRGRPRR